MKHEIDSVLMDPDILKHFLVVNVDLLMDKVERYRDVSSRSEFSRVSQLLCVVLESVLWPKRYAKIISGISKCQTGRNNDPRGLRTSCVDFRECLRARAIARYKMKLSFRAFVNCVPCHR